MVHLDSLDLKSDSLRDLRTTRISPFDFRIKKESLTKSIKNINPMSPRKPILGIFFRINRCNSNIVEISTALFTLSLTKLILNSQYEEDARDFNNYFTKRRNFFIVQTFNCRLDVDFDIFVNF